MGEGGRQEFAQIPNRLQAKVRGTGLGLSLSRRLAELLGGTVGGMMQARRGRLGGISP